MQVQMKTTLCGPSGSHFPGRLADLPADQAKDLIADGYAVAVGGKAPRAARPAKAKADQGGLGLVDQGAAP